MHAAAMRVPFALLIALPLIACGPAAKPDNDPLRMPAYAGPIPPTGALKLVVEPQENGHIQVTLHNGTLGELEYNLSCSLFEQQVDGAFTPVGDSFCLLYAQGMPALYEMTYVYPAPVAGGTFRMTTDVRVLGPVGGKNEALVSEPFELP